MIEIRNYIETQGYFYKSKAFEAENEFRVMITIADKRVPTQKKMLKNTVEYITRKFVKMCVLKMDS